MTRKVALLAAGTAIFGAATLAAQAAGIDLLPAILLFPAGLGIVGLLSLAEDRLIAQYDTPPQEGAHPLPLVLLRAGRTIVLLLLGIVLFYLAF